MARFYQLGQTMTPREILTQAYGVEAHPLTPISVEFQRLKRDGTIAYELAKSDGEVNGREWWSVFFARVENGRGIAMPEQSKTFGKEAEALDWINTVEQNGGNVS